jgi:basic amino acid/polyamine antiporter, APA family
MAMAIVVGTIIGSGVFAKPRQVAEQLSEPFFVRTESLNLTVTYFGLVALAWALGGVLALLGSLALAEVAVLYPRAGGNYVYLREGYGRLAGFLFGWVEFWIIRAASIAALATIFAESLHDVLRNDAFRYALNLEPAGEVLGFWQQRVLTVSVILGLAMVNVRGVRWGGVLQLLITLVKVGSLLAIMALPLLALWLAHAGYWTAQPHVGYLMPLFPDVWSSNLLMGFGTALLGVMFAYHGWMNIAPVAEEVRNPNRNLPLAFICGTGVVIFLYLGANLAYSLTMPGSEMAAVKDTTVATVFAMKILGPIGAAFAAAAVMCSVFGALNGNLLVGPRLLYAMGEDGLAPRSLAAVHPRWHTPALAILVMAAWSSLLVVSAALLVRFPLPVISIGGWNIDVNVPPNKSIFDILTAFAMFGATTFETLAVSTIFVFRIRQPNTERPYRCPGYPFVPLLYVAILALVVANIFWTQLTEALIGMAFIGIGAVVYFISARPATGPRNPFDEPPPPPTSDQPPSDAIQTERPNGIHDEAVRAVPEKGIQN